MFQILPTCLIFHFFFLILFFLTYSPASHRAKEEIPDVSPTLEPWAIFPMDCPIVLRKVLTKTNDGLGCRCVVKIPLITDLEFEKFITAPRDPQQVIVICVLSPQKHSYSPFFEWSVEQLYIKIQHGRPSPCIQVN